MDENEIAEKFSEIVETEMLINHPEYRRLMHELDVAAVNLWTFMSRMGRNDIRSIKSQAYNITKGRLEDFFKYTCLIEEENSDGTSSDHSG